VTGKAARSHSVALAPVGKWTRTGLTLPLKMTYDEWAALGLTIQSAAESVMWWVGDWWLHGERAYGEAAAQAAPTGYASETLRAAGWVCSRFESVLRRTDLSFRHHKEVAGFPPEEASAILAMAAEHEWSIADLRQYLRTLRHAARTINRDWPEGRYGVILCDPPWQPDAGLLDPTRVIENQYPTMTVDEICALGDEVRALAASDCVLLMWVVTQKIAEAMRVMDAWGFTQKSGAVWVKDSIGMGYWFRSRHELLLLGTVGHPATPLEDARADSVIQVPRRAHSQKPDEQYALVGAMFPGVPAVELFARANDSRPASWATWGNESL